MAIMYKHCYQPPKNPRKIRPEIPEALANVCMNALLKIPGNRYQTMDDLAADLDAAAAGRAVPPRAIERLKGKRELVTEKPPPAAMKPERAEQQTVIHVDGDLPPTRLAGKASQSPEEQPSRGYWAKLMNSRAAAIATAVGVLMVGLVTARVLKRSPEVERAPAVPAENAVSSRDPSTTRPRPPRGDAAEPVVARPAPRLEPAAPPARPASPVAKPPGPDPMQPRRLRWFGYAVSRHPQVMSEIAQYTNIVCGSDWLHADNPDELANAAREAGLKVVYRVYPRTSEGPTPDDVLERVVSFVRKHRDVITAVSWHDPQFHGQSPDDCKAVARRLKEALPGIEYWLEFEPRPPTQRDAGWFAEEVDVFVLNLYSAVTPLIIRRFLGQPLSKWQQCVGDRPLILQWMGWAPVPPGPVPVTNPMTMQVLARTAERQGVAGLLFYEYRDSAGPDVDERAVLSIDANPALVAAIKTVAKDLGFARQLPGEAR